MFSSKTEDLLLEQLQESGLLTERDIAQARGAQKGDESLLETIIKTGILSDEQIAQTVAVNSGMEYVDLHGYMPHQGMKDLVPLEVALRYKVAPLGADGTTLQIVVSDPYDFETLDALPHVLQPDIEFFCSTPSLIKTLI